MKAKKARVNYLGYISGIRILIIEFLSFYLCEPLCAVQNVQGIRYVLKSGKKPLMLIKSVLKMQWKRISAAQLVIST